MKLFKALKNKTNAFKKLTRHVQTAILLPANPTALPRPAQATQSAQDTGHPAPNAGSIKISYPVPNPGWETPGGLPSVALQPSRDFAGKLITACQPPAERARYGQPRIRGGRVSPAVFDGKAGTSSPAPREKPVP